MHRTAAVWVQIRPVPKSPSSRLYNVDRGTHLQLLGTKRCIIWGRGRAVWVQSGVAEAGAGSAAQASFARVVTPNP